MPLFAFRAGSLEVELPSQLHYSAGAIGAYLLDSIDLSEGAAGGVIYWRPKIRMVKGVERL